VRKAWYANSRPAWLNRSRPILRLATPIRTAIRIPRRRNCWPLRAHAPGPFHLGSARHASRTEPSGGRFNASRTDRAPGATSPRSRISSPQQRAGRGPPARRRKASSRPGRLRLSRHRTTRSSSDSGARPLQRKRSLTAAPIRWPCCRIADALRAVGGGSSWRRYPRRRTAVTATAALTEPSIHRRPPARRRS
jgi:hypothetical protein